MHDAPGKGSAVHAKGQNLERKLKLPLRTLDVKPVEKARLISEAYSLLIVFHRFCRLMTIPQWTVMSGLQMNWILFNGESQHINATVLPTVAL